MRSHRKTMRMTAAAMLGVSLCSGAVAYEPLADEQLDAITAGMADDDVIEEIAVKAVHRTASGKLVTAEGTLAVQQIPASLANADLLLQDSAQGNLRALVNLNAVHSVVNVLVNLNINIDSHVAELRQINLASGTGH